MKSIWKYRLSVTDVQAVNIPAGAKILCVQIQGGIPCLWAMVDPLERLAQRRVRIFGTGQPARDFEINGIEYIGTIQMSSGSLVWHVFVEPEA